MKKNLFGYNVSEVDIVLAALREENESLHSTITSLQTHIKNIESGTSAKASLLESDLNRMQAENEELVNQISELNRQLTERSAKTSASDIVIQELKTELDTVLVAKASAEQSLQDNSKEFDAVKEELNSVTCALTEANTKLEAMIDCQEDEKSKWKALMDQAVKEAQEKILSMKASLSEKTIALEKAHKDILQLKEELSMANAAKEQEILREMEKSLQTDLNYAAKISHDAYYDMSRLRKEVIEYLHEQMKEYYQLVNDNSVKMRAAIEKRQAEYSQINRDFFTMVSKFRISLSNLDSEYNDMADYRLNIDYLSNRMNEIMDNFMNETNIALKEKDHELGRENTPISHLETNPTQELSNKALRIQDFRQKKSDMQNCI